MGGRHDSATCPVNTDAVCPAEFVFAEPERRHIERAQIIGYDGGVVWRARATHP
ncbi:hypothetical protein L0A91_14755 [Ornithinimicrobium sp. INDO-MA30-4]|nr:hypothetical protein [Ornithinimicrobium sp. INDO-MA30-4]UJH70372.1 hypothetical protein L0A91_14755 [Ornithinimicrobium sp. INDO-MA30-4]